MGKEALGMGIHGGDIYRNHVKLDFSVNINPLGMPGQVKKALHRAVESCGTYPDIESERLKLSASRFLAVPEEYLLFGNGASELLMAIVHGLKPKKTVIPAPSFYGYEYAAKSVDSEIIFYELKQENNFCITKDIKEVLTEGVDLLFLANPNNPVGNLFSIEDIKALLRHCSDRRIYVVLDECFIEFCRGNFSMLPELSGKVPMLSGLSGEHSALANGFTGPEGAGAFDRFIVLRAFTKIFAIPGVRLGYLACKNKQLLDKIARQLPEWNLSCFAQEAGQCVGQTVIMAEYIQKTQKYVERERTFLEGALKRKGLVVYPSAANFILVYSKEPLYERLLEKGVLIRDCSNFRGLGRGFYRIAVLGRKENEVLLESLKDCGL